MWALTVCRPRAINSRCIESLNPYNWLLRESFFLFPFFLMGKLRLQRGLTTCSKSPAGPSCDCDRVHRTFHYPRGSELRPGGQTAKMKIQAPQWTHGAIFLWPPHPFRSLAKQLCEVTFLLTLMVAPATWPGANWWGAQLSGKAARFIKRSFLPSGLIKAMFSTGLLIQSAVPHTSGWSACRHKKLNVPFIPAPVILAF